MPAGVPLLRPIPRTAAAASVAVAPALFASSSPSCVARCRQVRMQVIAISGGSTVREIRRAPRAHDHSATEAYEMWGVAAARKGLLANWSRAGVPPLMRYDRSARDHAAAGARLTASNCSAKTCASQSFGLEAAVPARRAVPLGVVRLLACEPSSNKMIRPTDRVLRARSGRSIRSRRGGDR
jgi:hypothetical protein